jgi:hypothetical protein
MKHCDGTEGNRNGLPVVAQRSLGPRGIDFAWTTRVELAIECCAHAVNVGYTYAPTENQETPRHITRAYRPGTCYKNAALIAPEEPALIHSPRYNVPRSLLSDNRPAGLGCPVMHFGLSREH